MRALSLWIAVWTISGCASFQKPSVPYNPPFLEASLSQPCQIPDAPTENDYDVFLSWVILKLLPAFGDCAVRHDAIVKAWPKAHD